MPDYFEFSDDDPAHPIADIMEFAAGEDLVARLAAGDEEAQVMALEVLAGTENFVAGCDAHGELLIVRALLREMEDMLRHGDHAEAAHRLRLATAPKWKRLPDCVAAYDSAFGIVYGPPLPPPPPRQTSLFDTL